jgi:hypothetical protein
MAYHDPNLRPGGSSHLPGIFQNFAAGALVVALGAGFMPGITYCWETFVGGKLPDWVHDMAPNAIGALVLIPIFGLTGYGARLLWSRRHTGSARARGNRLAIYVAWIEGDDARGAARSRIMYSLRQEIGGDTVEVLPAGLRPRWHADLGFEAVKAATEPKAHRLLRRKGGHLLIWGRLDHLDGRSVLELSFTSPHSAAAEGRYGFTGDKLLLDSAFGPEAGAALAAVTAALASPAADSSRFIADRLRPLADRLRPLAHRPPVALRQDDRGRILFSYALLREAIGEQSGQSDQLAEAIAAYRAALTEWTRERVPLQWAMTQNNLGNALTSLGGRESGTARLEEAVEAYRAALTERTRERVPLDWAMTQNNLGAALQRLGERESGTARLEEAVAAFDAALEVFVAAKANYYIEHTQDNRARAAALLEQRRKQPA